jgi:hypothetical protein
LREYPIPEPAETIIRPGDVFLTRSNSLLAKAIRLMQRGEGEEKSVVNHTGLFLNGQEYARLDEAMSIEALARVRVGRFWDFYHDSGTEVAIYRDITLTAGERRAIEWAAQQYRGRLYGGLKLPLHAGDWMLEQLLNKRDVYVFRRLAKVDRYPICSYLVAKSYSAVGRNFGVAVGAAQPDDIWDYVRRHPEKWPPVLTLRRV